MRKTVSKWFWAWDFDKEEAWLNEMAAKGLALVAVCFCRYTFEEGTPGEYRVRLELLENLSSHPESQNYISFLEETGAEYLGYVNRWIYVRKKTALGTFDLYSDTPSRIRHLNRVLALLGVCGVLNIAIGAQNLSLHLAQLTRPVNLFMGCTNLGLGLLIAYGFFRILFKKRRLKKEQSLFE